MHNVDEKVCVYYDGACPSCVRDRDNYQRMAGDSAKGVDWVDITGRDAELNQLGIDPQKALQELHIKVERPGEKKQILSELDAYIVLMGRTRCLKWLAMLISLPIIRPILSKLYHWMVHRRLKRTGRLPDSKP